MVTFPFPIPPNSPFPVANIPIGIFSTESNVRRTIFVTFIDFFLIRAAKPATRCSRGRFGLGSPSVDRTWAPRRRESQEDNILGMISFIFNDLLANLLNSYVPVFAQCIRCPTPGATKRVPQANSKSVTKTRLYALPKDNPQKCSSSNTDGRQDAPSYGHWWLH